MRSSLPKASRSSQPDRLAHLRRLFWLLPFLSTLVHLACGKSRPTGPDSTPPAPVTRFAASVQGSDTVLLTWVAPGDDGINGQAATYDIRKSQLPITTENFAESDTIGTPPDPATAGVGQRLYATNLPGNSNYYFAIRASDEGANRSPIRSLGPIHTPADTIPPAPVTDLHILSTSDTTLTLGWTASGDDSHRGRVNRYEVRYLGGVLNQSSWAVAHPATLPVTPLGLPGTPASSAVFNLTPRVSLSIALKSIDESDNQSVASNTLDVKLTAGPRTWLVRADGTGMAPSIQAAIDSAENGDTVMAQPGVYHELIDFTGKAIHVKSALGPSETTLDGTGRDGPVVSFAGPETRSSIIEGFTITGGSGFQLAPTQRYGGGIFCPSGSPTIRGNVIRDNNLPGRSSAGGGIAIGCLSLIVSANPLIENNLIEDNFAGQSGGGIALVYCSATLKHNILRRNFCGFDGGGIWGYLLRGGITIEGGEFTENVGGDHGGAIEADGADDRPNSGYTITGGLFLRNRAEGRGVSGNNTGTGGAIAIRGTRGSISHNTFVGNVGTSQTFACTGGTLLLDLPFGPLSATWNIIVESQGCGITCYSAPDAVIEKNLFWSNTPSDIGHVGPDCALDLQTNNLFADPRFCGAQTGNYHLSADSPATIQGEVIGAYPTLGCSYLPLAYGSQSLAK